MDRDLQDRLFRFSVEVIKTLRGLPKTSEFRILSDQLIRAATSSGANYEEAQGAISAADFRNKIAISLKEMLEANYWLRILIETSDKKDPLKKLASESEELKKILGAIYSKSRKRS
jgi:four helix bundle protein